MPAAPLAADVQVIVILTGFNIVSSSVGDVPRLATIFPNMLD